MKRVFIAVALISTTSAFAQSTKKLEKIATTISPEDLKTKLTVIAGPGMEGRETATEGQRKAAAYIENTFKQLGLQPGTATGYQMYYPVYQDSVTGFSFSVNGKNLIPSTDYVLSTSSIANGNWTEDSLVFASFGIVDSTVNNYKDLNVKNKWVIASEGRPEDADKAPGSVGYSYKNAASVFMKLMQARENGAKGLIIITKDFPRRQLPGTKGNMYVKQSSNKPLPLLYVSVNTASLLLGMPLGSFADTKNVSAGVYPSKFSFSSTAVVNTMQSSNVIGVLPGTDKKDEYIFITGHYDHLGKKDSVIYYGADDDGSGTTSVLELAEAFAEAKKKGQSTKRSIVFMTVSGEEKGLWGSDYYTDHPVFPLDKTSVDLNIDMVGRIDPDRKYGDSTNYVYTIGEDKLSSELLHISDSINSQFSHIELDRKYNDPNDPNRFYYRSDHFNFAKHGVPVIFYFNGTHRDYHQPTDTVDKINFDLMAKRVKLVFYTAWDMANRDSLLKRDIPLK